MFRIIRKLIWKLYKGFCFFTGTLVLIYPFLLGLVYFSKQFEKTYLSEDIYIVKRSIFGNYSDILLRKVDGANIFEGEIWDVCFNENYIYVDTSDSTPDFLYVIQEDRKVYFVDPEYSDLYRSSNLYKDGSSMCAANRCSGATDTLMRPVTPDFERKTCKAVLSKEE